MLNKWPHVSLESHPASLPADWGLEGFLKLLGCVARKMGTR